MITRHTQVDAPYTIALPFIQLEKDRVLGLHTGNHTPIDIVTNSRLQGAVLVATKKEIQEDHV